MLIVDKNAILLSGSKWLIAV